MLDAKEKLAERFSPLLTNSIYYEMHLLVQSACCQSVLTDIADSNRFIFK